jgi:sterol desaturase/sphingolipid hydroxylase (fatty acid hydroxylase superfamily)
MGAAWWLRARGVGGPLVLAALVPALLPLIFLLERWLPFRQGWRRDHGGDTRVDVLHLLVSARFFDAGVALPWAAALWLRGGAGPSPWWPSSWPLGLQVPLILLTSELLAYALHRAQHEIPYLWRFHAVHHGAPRVYFVNVARNHPLDALPSGVITGALVAAWGPGEAAMLLAGAFSTAHALLQHANIDLRLGPLRGLISGPEAHRWHHSTRPEESNANYGQVLLVFDWLLGTLRVPPGPSGPERVGLASGEVVEESYLAQMKAPWRQAEQPHPPGPLSCTERGRRGEGEGEERGRRG